MRGRLLQLLHALPLLFAALALPAADGQYTIKEGETLFSVARRAQVPVEVLGAYNGISNASRVKAGTVLRVPTVYTVKKGDTLYSIARSFGIPIGKLLELNRMGQNTLLKVGERLYVPLDAGRPAIAEAGTPQRPAGPDPVTGQAVSTDAVANSAAPNIGAPNSAVPTSAVPTSAVPTSAVPTSAVPTSASASRPDAVVVWPHPGRHEPDNGKIPGLIFYGSPGDVVRSATSGEVKWAATYWTRGKVVIIKSADGTLFTYGGNAELLVNVGDRVSAGMDIAKLGQSPQGGGAKLYFSISDSSGHALNPERFFAGKNES